LNKSVLQSTLADKNFDNTGHLATDGLFKDPTVAQAPRPVVSASTASSTGPAASAFDYTMSNQYWVSTGTLSASNPQWVAIDLLSAHALRGYRVQPHCNGSGTGAIQNNPTAWEFQGSNDGSDWTTLDTVTNQTGADVLPCRGRTYPVADANFQHYRLFVTAAATSTVRVSEIYLYGPDGYPVVPKPVFDSTWRSSTAATGQSLTMDLGAPSDFDVVKLMWESDTTAFASAYTIETSNDGETWVSAATVADASGWLQQTELATPQVGKRYVRVSFTSRVGADYRLQELEIWGTSDYRYSVPAVPAPEADGTQYLTGGDWKLGRAYQTDITGEELSTSAGAAAAANWLPATVPGTVLTSFLNAGALVDPDFADYQLQISDSYFTNSDWWYSNTFQIPISQEGKRTWLNFQAINWKANVYLNGQRLGTRDRVIADGDYDLEGAFTPGKFDITDVANYGGANYLAVLIKKNDNPGAPTVQQLTSSGSNGGILGGDNPSIHASIGWDWLPTIRGRNIGIYEDVFINYSGDVRVENSWAINRLDTVTKDFSTAEVTIKGELTNASSEPRVALVTAMIEPLGTAVVSPTFVRIAPGETVEYTMPTIEIDHPDLWWPNGYGDQPLYDVSVSVHAAPTVFGPYVLSDEQEFKHGIRVVEYEWRSQPELDAKDSTANRNPHAGMNIYVNGTRVIARGGNWGLADRNMANTDEDYDLKMRLHKEANLNMVRNWVGMTGHPGFYEAADKYGIMLMDDFWLANPADGPAPHDERMFLNSAAAKIKRVRHHAAIVLWCGRNEGNPPAGLENPLRAFARTGTGTLDPTRTYVADSAGPREGMDGHGPYGVRDTVWYLNNTPAASGYSSNGNGAKNLSSERGMLSIPTSESMHRMMGENIPWPPVTATPNSAWWGIHDFCTMSLLSATEAERLLGHVQNTYDPNYSAHGVEDFITTVQQLNYDQHRALFEAMYLNNTPGLLQWMSQSAWPSMAWQTYDFWYDLNGGFYGEKAANRSINAILDIRDQTVVLSNETKSDLMGVTVKAEVFSLEGEKIGESSVVTSLEAGGRSSEYTLDQDLAVVPAIAVGQLIYRRVGEPLLSAPPIEDYSGTRFVRTSVADASGAELSSSFYWTNPDVLSAWPAGSRTSRTTNTPSTWANFKDIRTTLKGTDTEPVAPVPVAMHVETKPSPEAGWGAFEITLTNKGTLPAFQIHINGKDENGEQILPFIADDNYITLMPGESRTLYATYMLSGLVGNEARIGIDGFNVTTRSYGLPADPTDVEALRQMIDVYAVVEAGEELYTPRSFAPFAKAMAAGRAALAIEPPERAAVEWALEAIPETAGELVDAIVTEVLEALITKAEEILANAPQYVAVSLVGLAEAVASAKLVLVDPLTQAEVSAEELALSLAIAKATLKGEKTPVNALIMVTESLKSDLFTPSSWAAVVDALAIAGAVVENPEASVDEVEAAFGALKTALESLVLRALKGGLKSAIDIAETIMANSKAYVTSTLAGLPEALAAAKLVHDNNNATPEQVNTAQTNLLVKLTAVRLKAPSGASTTLVTKDGASALASDPAAVAEGVAAAEEAAGKAMSTMPAPKIAGKAKVGARLRAKTEVPSSSITLSYQWYRDGKKASKATKPTFKVRKSDAGKKITVKVTAQVTGFAKVVKTSKPTKRVK